MISNAFKSFYNIESRRHSMLYVFCFIYYLITMIMPSVILALNVIDHGYFSMNYYYPISIMIFAAVNGYTIFKYLHNKADVDFIHSLPAKRENILYSKLIFGFNVYFLPTVFSLAIEYLVLLYLRPNAIILESAIIKMFVCNTLYYILCYFIMSFCMCVTGSKIFAIFLNFFIHILGFLLVLSQLLLSGSFDQTANNNFLTVFFGYLSPIYSYIKLSQAHVVIIPMAVLIIYIIVMFRICQYTFINRKLENYNKIFSFDTASKLVHIFVSAIIGLLGGETLLIFYEYDIANLTKLVILIVGVLVFATVTFIVIELLYNKKIVLSFNKIIGFILSLLIPAFIVILYTYTLGA